MAKRGQGEGSISKRPDGTWWARISLGVTSNGKRKRKAFYGKTRKEVQEKLTAALNDENNAGYIEPTKMTLAHWMDIWLCDYKKRSVKPSTFYRMCCTVEVHIKPHLGHYKLTDLRPDMVQKFVNQMDENGLAPSTIKRNCSTLRIALHQAVKNELLPKNPASDIIRPPETKTAIRVLSPDDQERFIEAAKVTEHGEFFILALCTGMRLGEMLALTWDDVNFENNEISVTKSVTKLKDYYKKEESGKRYISNPKTEAGNRIIPLLPQIRELLINLKSVHNNFKVKFGNTYQDENLVFCHYNGKPFSSSGMHAKLKKMTKRIGIDDFHIHCLRHTFATRGLESGIELKVMQELLGHSSIQMTADLYTHVLPHKRKESMEKLTKTIKI